MGVAPELAAHGLSAAGLSITKYAALFAREAREHLRTARESARRIAADTAAADEIDALFRSVHTVKGMAGAMGYASVEDVAHALEDALARLRDAPSEQRATVVPLLATGVEALDDAVEASIAPNGSSFDAAAVRDVVAALAAATDARPAAPSRRAAAEPTTAPQTPAARTLRVDVAAPTACSTSRAN